MANSLMRCRIDPGFVSTADESRYFVRWLEPWEFGWKTGDRWEVRCLDESGQVSASVQFGPKDRPEAVQEAARLVPAAVLDVARSGAAGCFDALGRVVGSAV